MGKRSARREIWRLEPPTGGALRVAVIYPNSYAVGMANLGLHALLEQLCAWPVTLDRVFISHDDPSPPRSQDLGLNLSAFHALIFSVSFEPDYVGLALALSRAGMAPLAADRSARDPLVVAGGMALTLNPEPAAPLCDLVGVGEAEALLPTLVPRLLSGPGKEDLVQRLAGEPGWYAPAHHDPATCVVERQHAELQRPVMPVVLGQGAAFGGHVDLEVSRGCRWRCRFCAAGHVVTPYRELSPERLQDAIAWAADHRGRVGLVGTDVSDHGHLRAIAERVWDAGAEVALPSLRVESLARPGSQASWLLRQRPPRTLTVAVEAATDSLRLALNKKLGHEQLLRMAAAAKAAGVSSLKVYLLVGVPGETWEEIEAIPGLCQELLDHGPGGQLTLSVNGLAPKPGTPLQWCPAPELKYLRACRRLLRKRLPRGRVKLAFESPDWTRWQSVLGLGGREAARHVLLAAERGWRRALAAAAAEEPVLSGRGRPEDEPLPWAHVHPASVQEPLGRQWECCQQRRYTPPARLTGRLD